jgi:hypothetical protein
MLLEITKTYNTGESVTQEIEVPEGANISIYLSRASLNGTLGIWTEPDGSELENLEDVRTYSDNRVSGLIWRAKDTFDRIDIYWHWR